MIKDIGLRPLGSQVILKRSAAKKVTKGGILLPESSAGGRLPKEGQVVAVGPGELREDGVFQSTSVKVGEFVLFEPFSFTDVVVDDEEYIIMPEKHIIAVIK